jgi:hypothetical protein
VQLWIVSINSAGLALLELNALGSLGQAFVLTPQDTEADIQYKFAPCGAERKGASNWRSLPQIKGRTMKKLKENMKTVVAGALTALALSTAIAAAAVDTIPYWNSKIWKVEAIPMISKCMAQSYFDHATSSGSTLSFQFFLNGNAGVMIDSPDWRGTFKKGKKYYVLAMVNKGEPVRLLGESFVDGGLVFDNLSQDAVKAFAESYELSFGYKNKLLAAYNLKGSYDAVVATLRCVSDLRRAIGNNAAAVDDGTGEVEEERTGAPLQQVPAPLAAPTPQPAPAPTPKRVAPPTETTEALEL